MIRLENELLSIGFDDGGRIVSLVHRACGNTELIGSICAGSFLMVLADEHCKEILVYAENQSFTAVSDGITAAFHTDRLCIDDGRADAGSADISLTLKVRLDGDSLLFSADIDNREADKTVIDFEYPKLGDIRSLGNGEPTLFWPDFTGRLYMNIGNRLISSREMCIDYVGMATVGTFALLDRESSLFIGVEDPEFIACQFRVTASTGCRGAVCATVDKHLCIKNTHITTAPVRVRLYRGDWHYGAACYAEWMSAFRPAHTRPDWVRGMDGYFLVINKQQYGYELWDYSTLPRLYEIAAAHGFDTLGLFGWFETGHDNNYPDLEVSHSMGGEEALKRNIEAVQAAGGHVTLYYQGHLIDICSDYYTSGDGQRVSSKNIWGTNYAEYYPKYDKSCFLRSYSRKMFALACPSCPEWRELMVERENWIESLGADGALYDQIGGMPPYICFDEDHPHDGGNPARAVTGGQKRLVSELQENSKRKNPDFAFMSEHVTDYYSSCLDMCHGCGFIPGAPGERSNNIGDGGAGTVSFPDLFRYCFPDAVITVRNTQPFIPRRTVNFAFVFGLIPELEVRYRDDREVLLGDLHAAERQYSAFVSEFRRKYKNRVAFGTYTDTDGIAFAAGADSRLIARGYCGSDGALAVTLWNDSDTPIMPQITVPGKKLISFETPDGEVGDTLRELGADSIAMAVYA